MQPRRRRAVAVLQARDARVETLATERRRRSTTVRRVGACVRVFVTRVVGTKKVVVATAGLAEAESTRTGVDAIVYGAEQSVVALRVGRTRPRRACLGARGAVQVDKTKDRHDKRGRPLPKSM